MDAITISAKFAAYTWFAETVCGKDASQEEATRFAEANRERFLAHADKGFGHLLLRLAQRRPARKALRRRREAA